MSKKSNFTKPIVESFHRAVCERKTYTQAILEATLGDPFAKNLDHPTVDLDGDNVVGHFEKLHGEIPSTRSDLQDRVGGSYRRFLHDGIENSLIGQKVLTFALVQTQLGLVVVV